MAKRTKQRKKTTRNKTNSFVSWLKKLFFSAFLIFTFLFLTYLGYLDYNIRKQFEGKRWAIPARVYASPVELYSGYTIGPERLESLMNQLNYQPDPRLSSEGTYYRNGNRFAINTRGFLFWDKSETSRRISLTFSGNTVASIVDVNTAKDVAIARLDPVKIGSFYPSRKEDRILIKLEETPDALIQGLMSTEDKDFYNHYGISIRSILRALLANIRAGGIVQGGSTITQQLVKNFYLTPEKSLWRKANEAFMALILEARYSKNEILEAYLNEVYLGQDGASAVHGFGLASEFYFALPLEKLETHQLATLVAMIRGPSYYDPRRYPQRAKDRRDLVLDAMSSEGYITVKQAEAAKAKDLDVIPYKRHSSNRYPAFLDLVRRQLSKEYRDENLTSEGLRIFTTMDTSVQEILEKTVKSKLAELERSPRIKSLEAAVVVTSRDSGEIVALAGGRDNQSAGFNRALDAVRQIGSLIKPVVYLTALENPAKYTATTMVSDTAVTLKSKKGKTWSPKNYDGQEHGDVPLFKALANSYNLATVHVGMDVGIARTAKTLKNLGVKRKVKLYPSLLLGAASLTPFEVAQMYQTLAGDGFATPLRAIRAVISVDGEPLQRYPFTVRQTVDPAATYITNTILQEVVRSGTARSAYQQLPADLNLAGKTGTTNGLKDSWFAGFSGDYLSVAWVGRDDNRSTGLTGSSGALRIWTSLMGRIANQPVSLIPPDNIEFAWIDPANGLRANENCPGAAQFPFVTGSAPERQSVCTITPTERPINWFERLFENRY
ncbi:MAG: penicillin-binding protein 1B [Gammaproteobacteria bacterium]